MELKRELKLLDVFCIASGAMISSGLFILPGLAHAMAGPAVIVSYLLAGLLAMTGMLSQAELASAMPRAGGTYFYVTRSMGPALGTINGLLTWMSITLKSSFALIGMAAFTSAVVPWDIKYIALGLCVLFVALNLVGVKEASRVQVAIVVLLLGILSFYVVKGFPAVDHANLRPFAPYGMVPVFSAAGFVFVSYGGLLKIASIAEEVQDPGKTVPRGMILSLVLITVVYALVVYVTSGVLDSGELDKSLTPISDGAEAFLNHPGRIALGFAAILAFISTANAGIMSASRYPLALSRDRLLPPAFGKINRKTSTPFAAILLTGILMASALFLKLDLLVKVASTVLIFTFIFSCLCVIVMRESGVRNYQPKFRAPFYPWLQIAGVFGCWLLVVNIGKAALILGSFLFAAGLSVYWFYGRQRGKKDFAFLHLIERVAAKEFMDISLETELRDIIRERDNIEKDRFDRIVEECVVVDIPNKMTAEDFFRDIAVEIASRLDCSPSEVFRLLLDREEQASTVLKPGLAIPHIIVNGEHQFLLFIARCRQGIFFPGAHSGVNAVFVIAGSRDERPFHLRALSAIAQIVEDPAFEKKWMDAEDEAGLRDIILLGKRKRT
ncbi:MAG: amino acid permease [Candidatus Omnitrophica bacterium]|nr:amino acid permease [Candidatus Omnitrophota bacterium]